MTAPNSSPSLEELWDDIPTGYAPVADLIRGGRRVRWLRRAAAVVGAAAVAVVVAGIGFAGDLVGSAGGHRQQLVASAPVVPDGTRLVGAGRVALAVPEDWVSGGADGCLAVDNDADLTRPLPRSDVHCPSGGQYSSVSVARLDTDGGYARRFATARREVDGVEVLTGQGDCMDTGYCVFSSYPTYLVVPSENVVFSVFGPERDQPTLDAIVNSIRVLPAGYTTVPSVDRLPVDEAQQVLQAAGFSVELTTSSCGPNDLCARPELGKALGTDPEAGSVISKGSAITLFGG